MKSFGEYELISILNIVHIEQGSQRIQYVAAENFGIQILPNRTQVQF